MQQTTMANNIMKEAFPENYQFNLSDPDISVKDERILELDKIVNEVRQSEEWEAVKMNIMEIGIEKGIDLGKAKALVENVESLMKNWGMTLEEVCKGMGITAEEYNKAKGNLLR